MFWVDESFEWDCIYETKWLKDEIDLWEAHKQTQEDVDVRAISFSLWFIGKTSQT